MPSLIESRGEIIVGSLRPPLPGIERGCIPPSDASPFDPDNFCRENDELADIHIVHRGKCNFRRKSMNYHKAKAVIVINSNPNELFVMAGEGERKPLESGGCSDDDLPITVLGKYIGDV